MKSNFHIKTQKQNQDLYIDLYGIFDGACAFELTHTINQRDDHKSCVFIDTSRLTRIHAFGKAILNFSLPRNTIRAKIHFSGLPAKEIRFIRLTRTFFYEDQKASI
ncbi:MAG: hypothetical protein GY710_20345 [Desulfobacteraceae bacterium]|nr:hypothetical protein [Desulfobacteraceae bacterium]